MSQDKRGLMNHDILEGIVENQSQEKILEQDNSNLLQDSDLIELIKNNILHDKIREQEQIKELKREIEFLKSEITHKNKVITCLLTNISINAPEKGIEQPGDGDVTPNEHIETARCHDNYDIRYETISANNTILRRMVGNESKNKQCKHLNQHVLNKIIARGGEEKSADAQFVALNIFQDVDDPKPSRFSRRNFYQSLLQVDI